MRRWFIVAVALLVAWILVSRARAGVSIRMGDLVSLGAVGFTLAIEALIVLGGWLYRNNPRVIALAERRAELDLDTAARRRRARGGL